MFVYDDVIHDSRVRREARALAADGHEVTIVGRPSDVLDTTPGESELDGIRVLSVPIPSGWRRRWRLGGAPFRFVARAWGRLRGRANGGRTLNWLVIWRFAVGGWARSAAAAAPPADAVHGHDLSGLLAAAAVYRRTGIPFVYDSHELFLEAGTVATQPPWSKAGLRRTESRLARAAAAVITVNAAIADELVARYGVTQPTVVYNCPPRPTNTPSRDLLRSALGLGPDVPIVICHGGFGANRGIEQTAAAMLEPGLEDAHLVFLGRATPIVERILAMPGLRDRVHLLPPVPPDDVVDWIAGADVAAMPIQPSSLNHLLSTPNKLFESFAAGVPVVSSDAPVRHRIVIDDPDGPLGAVCDPERPASIAAAIRSILDLPQAARADLRARCLRAAMERWNWETESARLLDVYRGLATSR